MPNGNPQPSGPEVEALVRRSALLAAKVTSLVDDGFSRDEAMQILFVDIEAGLTEFGTPAPTTGLGAPPVSAQPPIPSPPPLDLSTLIGNWNITPSPLREECRFPVAGREFLLDAVSVEIAFVGQGQSRIDLLFRDGNGNGTRAEGSLANTGGSRFVFLGQFDVSRVRLRLNGSVVDNALEVTFHFEYDGTPFDTSFGQYCRDGNYPRTLVRI
jgi:hypothetical protein